MFTRRLRVLIGIRERLTSLRMHSNGLIQQSNLNFSYCHQIKSNYLHSKRLLLLGSTVRKCTSLSTASESDHEDDEIEKIDKERNRLTENRYAYSILENSKKMSKTIVPRIIVAESIPDEVVEKILTKTYEECCPSEILNDFRIISFHAFLNNIDLSAQKHDKILYLLMKYIDDFSNEDLWNLMRYLELWYPMNIRTKLESFQHLENNIDKQCLLRFNDMSIDESLMVCDLWFHLRQARQSQFVSRVMKKLGTRPTKLTAENYLHYMYLINIARKPSINMYELEYALESIVDQFEANELGIIAMGFFKTQTPIRNPALLEKMIEKCIKDMDTMEDIPISAIMKITRYSLDLRSTQLFRNLLRAFEPKIKDASAPCLVHAAHAAATVLIYEKDILDAIINKFETYIPTARIKDLERMLFVLTIFNYPKETPSYNLIIQELRNPQRASEIASFPKTLSYALMYLCHMELYPVDIIEKVMHPDYLQRFMKGDIYLTGKQYLNIDASLKIEVPEYKGHFLPEKILNRVAKKFSAYMIQESDTNCVPSHQKFLIELVHHTKEILGPSSIIVEQLLPHYQRLDLVFCVDEKNNCVSTKSLFPNYPIGAIKYAPENPPGHRWLALVTASHNHVFRDSTEICGTLNSKLRQLEKIGYTTILISYAKWLEMKTIQGRKHYVKTMLEKYNVNKMTTS